MFKNDSSSSSQRPSRCAFLQHILFFLTFASSLIFLLSRISARDPGSIFFDPNRAFRPRYSAERSKQADAFIKSAWLRSKSGRQHHPTSASEQVPLCVGVKSRTHERARSLRMTIGSLLQGMSEEERGKIDLKVLIAHVDPRLHPAVHEPWLRNAVDHVVLYNESLSSGEIEYLLELEMNEERQEEKMNEKEVFDYVYILKQCFESGSEYIAILEDDVLACDGWLHRSLAALREAEERSYRRSEKGDGFLYLSLFYTEKSLGWKPEDRAGHVLWSMFAIGCVAATLLAIRTWKPRSIIGRNATAYLGFWICSIVLPFLLVLYFSSGRLSMQPLPRGIVQIREQEYPHGLVFPHHQAGRLLEWLETRPSSGSVTALIEEWANANNQVRWTIVPSVLQHVGRDEEISERQTSWNIKFEEYDVGQLKKEHQEVQAEGRKIVKKHHER